MALERRGPKRKQVKLIARMKRARRSVRRKPRETRRAPVPRAIRGFAHRSNAAQAGARYAVDHPPPEGRATPGYVQQIWSYFWHSPEAGTIRRSDYATAASAFLEGVRRVFGDVPESLILLPTRQKVAAIITAMNEEGSLGTVLNHLCRLPLDEVIVVVNGSSDRTFELARERPNTIVVHYGSPLGHDVGRAVGAKLSAADILLFLDGDIAVPPEKLTEFVFAVEGGTDVALNDISPYLGSFAKRDSVSVVKEFLNRSLGRSDLGPNSLTAVPHALSRRAVETVGHMELMVPPRAQALALARGLSVKAPVSVDVVTHNRRRATNTGSLNPVERLILGDHLEALQKVLSEYGGRLAFPDDMRKRVGGGRVP